MNEQLAEFCSVCTDLERSLKRTDKKAILEKRIKNRLELIQLFKYALDPTFVFLEEPSELPEHSNASWAEVIQFLERTKNLYETEHKVSPFVGPWAKRFFRKALNVGVGPALIEPYLDLPKPSFLSYEKVVSDKALIGDRNRFTWLLAHLPPANWHLQAMAGVRFIVHSNTSNDATLEVTGGRPFTLEKIRELLLLCPYPKGQSEFQLVIRDSIGKLLPKPEILDRVLGPGLLNLGESVIYEHLSGPMNGWGSANAWPLHQPEERLCEIADAYKNLGYTHLHGFAGPEFKKQFFSLPL